MNKEQIRAQQLHAYRHVFFEFIDKVITILAIYSCLVASYCPPFGVAGMRNIIDERWLEFGFCRQQECRIAFAEQIR